MATKEELNQLYAEKTKLETKEDDLRKKLTEVEQKMLKASSMVRVRLLIRRNHIQKDLTAVIRDITYLLIRISNVECFYGVSK